MAPFAIWQEKPLTRFVLADTASLVPDYRADVVLDVRPNVGFVA